jgi:hypothetical protein
MSTPTTPFPQQGLPMVSVFSQYGLNEREVERLVPKLYPALQRSKVSLIAEYLGKPVLKKSKTRIFEIYRQADDFPAATIRSGGRTTSGSNLVLSWTDPSFEAIREGNMIKAESGATGIVISTNPGSATIAFLSNPNGSSAFVSADFAEGEIASDRGDVTNPNSRKSKTTLFTLPNQYKNIVSSISETVEVTAEEANQYTYLENIDGTNYYALSKVTQALQRMLVTQSLRMVDEIAPVYDESKPVGGSLIWQIKNQGGTYVPITSEITEQAFNQAIEQYVNKGGFNGNELVVCAGPSYLADVQKNVFKQYITTAGTTNTVGGSSVKGLDAYEYGYNGIKIKMVRDDVMASTKQFGYSDIFAGQSKRSKSALFINPAPVATEQGATMSPIQEYYYITPDMIVSEKAGMTDMMGRPNKNTTTGQLSSTVEISLNKTTQLTQPSGHMFHGQ